MESHLPVTAELQRLGRTGQLDLEKYTDPWEQNVIADTNPGVSYLIQWFYSFAACINQNTVFVYPDCAVCSLVGPSEVLCRQSITKTEDGAS